MIIAMANDGDSRVNPLFSFEWDLRTVAGLLHSPLRHISFSPAFQYDPCAVCAYFQSEFSTMPSPLHGLRSVNARNSSPLPLLLSLLPVHEAFFLSLVFQPLIRIKRQKKKLVWVLGPFGSSRSFVRKPPILIRLLRFAFKYHLRIFLRVRHFRAGFLFFFSI